MNGDKMVLNSFEVLAKDPKSILNPNYRSQLLVTLTIQVFIFSHGIATGWNSPTVHKLQLEDSPTNFVITVEQASWIGSLYGLGSFTGNVLYGIVINRIGRKWCMNLMALPHMSAWVLIFLSHNHFYLYIARFLIGVSAGANYVVTSIFISEIADCNIRGALSAMGMVFLSFGILVGYVISTHLDYYLVPCIVILLPIFYLVSIIRYPETPQHLLRNQKIDEARKSFYFYKRLAEPTRSAGNIESEANVEESPEFQELRIDVEKSFGKGGKLEVKDFLNGSALMGFCTAFVLILLNQFSGSYAFLNYTSDIFAYTGTKIDPNTCTIVIGVAQIVGSLCATFLVDRFGRKLMMLVSTGGLGICLALFGSYMQFTNAETKLQFNWIPVIIMISAIIFTCCGILGLIFTIVVEILPTKIRAIGTSIFMAILSVAIFVALKIFPVLLKAYGLATLMFSCFGVCVFGWFYLLFFQKETNGESMN